MSKYISSLIVGGISKFIGILTSSDTTPSTSSTDGAILLSGGIAINNTTDAVSFINGGTFTTLGGAAFGKRVFIEGDLTVNGQIITPNGQIITPIGNISQITFLGVNNKSPAANVTGLVFPNATVRSFKVLMSCVIIATTSLFAQFELIGVQTDIGWYFVYSYVGDNTSVIFTITPSGQVQYTSGNYPGFVSLTMKFTTQTITI